MLLASLLSTAIAFTPPAPTSSAPPSPPVDAARGDAPSGQAAGDAAPAWQPLDVPQVSIELLQAGNEPRVELRPRPAVGQRQRLELTLSPLVNRFIDNRKEYLEPPLEMRYVVQTEVRTVREDGSFVLAATVVEASPQPVRGNTDSQLSDTLMALEPLRGATCEIELSAQNAVKALRIPQPLAERRAEPPHVIDRLLQALQMVFVPAPDAPLGVDGRWQVVREGKVRGIQCTSTTVLDVTAVATTVSVTHSTKVTAQPGQALDDGRLPDARQVRLENLSGRGAGDAELRPGQVLPASCAEDLFVGYFASGRVGPEEAVTRLHEQTMVKMKARLLPEGN